MSYKIVQTAIDLGKLRCTSCLIRPIWNFEVPSMSNSMIKSGYFMTQLSDWVYLKACSYRARPAYTSVANQVHDPWQCCHLVSAECICSVRPAHMQTVSASCPLPPLCLQFLIHSAFVQNQTDHNSAATWWVYTQRPPGTYAAASTSNPLPLLSVYSFWTTSHSYKITLVVSAATWRVHSAHAASVRHICRQRPPPTRNHFCLYFLIHSTFTQNDAKSHFPAHSIHVTKILPHFFQQFLR